MVNILILLSYSIITVDTAYKIHRYKVQTLIKFKIAWKDSDVFLYIKRSLLKLYETQILLLVVQILKKIG